MGGEEADPRHRRLYGLSDRGTLEPGLLADLNLIDYDRSSSATPRWSPTCPPAAAGCSSGPPATWRPSSRATSTFAEGEDTGARPGRLVRGAR